MSQFISFYVLCDISIYTVPIANCCWKPEHCTQDMMPGYPSLSLLPLPALMAYQYTLQTKAQVTMSSDLRLPDCMTDSSRGCALCSSLACTAVPFKHHQWQQGWKRCKVDDVLHSFGVLHCYLTMCSNVTLTCWALAGAHSQAFLAKSHTYMTPVSCRPLCNTAALTGTVTRLPPAVVSYESNL